jgi:uncharacterized protein YgbK (DUF1537 family)
VEVEIERTRFLGFPFLVFDATSDEDLRLVALGGSRVERKILWVGSAGLARFLPLGWGRQTVPFFRHVETSRRVLVINGSFNPVNVEQFGVLSETRGIPTLWITEDDRYNSISTLQKIDALLGEIQQGKDAGLSVQLARSANSSHQVHLSQETLRYAVERCLQSGLVEGLILVGGDTAMEIYRNNGAQGIQIIGEIEPGIPFGKWIGGRLNDRSLVTKAGGFGGQTTLLRAVEFLHGEDNSRYS